MFYMHSIAEASRNQGRTRLSLHTRTTKLMDPGLLVQCLPQPSLSQLCSLMTPAAAQFDAQTDLALSAAHCIEEGSVPGTLFLDYTEGTSLTLETG